MIERIGTAITAQTNTAQSVRATENSESQKATEQSAVQTNDVRKYDRFVSSSEASRYGSPDDPAARKAFDAQHNAAQIDSSRSYDRLEISGKYISDSSSDDVDTTKLYQYTDTELKDFLIDGSITPSEYDAEISKRAY